MTATVVGIGAAVFGGAALVAYGLSRASNNTDTSNNGGKSPYSADRSCDTCTDDSQDGGEDDGFVGVLGDDSESECEEIEMMGVGVDDKTSLAEQQNDYYSGNPTADEYEIAPNSERLGYEDYSDSMKVTFEDKTLEDVTGVGPTTAEELRNNGFETVSDLFYASDEALMSVSGIGDYTVEQIRDDIGGVDHDYGVFDNDE